jgi:hypothetical protein
MTIKKIKECMEKGYSLTECQLSRYLKSTNATAWLRKTYFNNVGEAYRRQYAVNGHIVDVYYDDVDIYVDEEDA